MLDIGRALCLLLLKTMNQSLRLFLATLLALTIAFVFNIFFLNLFNRPTIDQILLMAFSTAALGYLIFSFWGIALDSDNPQRVAKKQFNSISPQSFFREHAPGIVLALLFFVMYIFIGLRINNPVADTTDNFLDADNSTWMRRIAASDGSLMEMRGPHPFAYFIFRPLGWLLNLVTHNFTLTAILLNTFTGALCVFMAWLFVKRQFQNSTYALLIASLLGLSTSHIFFGSVIETYIFSAAALIGFILVIQQGTDSLFAPVLMSLITFGITLTNFVQNFISFLVSHPRLKEIFRFAALTLSLGIVISLIHAAWYPSSKLFFVLSGAQAEEKFTIDILQEPRWRAIGRVVLLIRTILLYTVIAPQPYVFTKEVGGTFPRFNFFKISPETFSYSSYHGIGSVLVLLWVILLLVCGWFFVSNIIRTRKVDLSVAFLLSILFNFVLHVNYGYEPFLYSPDWAYALIFFVALSLAPLAKNRYFQCGMLIFLILLAYNQFQFFSFILATISPFYHKGV